MEVSVSSKSIRVNTTPTKVDIVNQTAGKAVTLVFQDDDGRITMYLSYEQIKFIAENCSNLPEPGKRKNMNVKV